MAYLAWIAERREQLGIAADSLVIGMIANLRAVKDQASLIRAVALLRDRFPNVVLVLIGGGDPASLQREAEAQGVAQMVRLPGAWPNVPSAHWLFDVSVLSSVSEGFPNSLVEAMAAGRPVVATAVGGIPDAVVHGETGLLVPPRAPEQLAEALATLLESPALREQFGAAGLVRARERFTSDVVLPQLGELYKSLARRR